MRHWHIAQTTLFWLIFSHTLAVIYFVDVVPLWLYGLSFIAIGWRLAVYLGSAIAPPRYLVVLIAIAAGILLALLSSGYNTMELLIQLMLVGYGLKFLELRQRRDVYVLVLLGYFVIAVALVVHQGMGATAWLALVMIFNTCALMTLQRPGLKSLGAIREVLRLLVISLPLTLVLFFAMPRVTQLWQMPQLSRADTGLSDSMAPGEFNSLSRDPSLAFRVTFEGPVPPRKQLYWRAIVLENYDGQRWQQDPGMAYWEEEGGTFGVTPVLPKGAPLNYEVIAEASYQRWLFGLQVPVSRSGEVGNTSDYRLIAEQSLTLAIYVPGPVLSRGRERIAIDPWRVPAQPGVAGCQSACTGDGAGAASAGRRTAGVGPTHSRPFQSATFPVYAQAAIADWRQRGSVYV